MKTRSCIVILLLWAAASHRAGAESTAASIARATEAMEAAAPRANADPAHPVFHITPPGQWMNDPNGPIYYRGWYHMFYQLHPFSDGDGPKYWGHARSRDLAKWETMPIALCPSPELGEQGVWSGCCTINGLGQPMIFYTSVSPNQSAQTHAEQWAAIGDQDLITWQKLPGNPVLSEALHGDVKIYEWRDPFIFTEGSRTFLVAGGNLNETRGGQAVVNIYEAQNPALTKWKYRGVLFHLPDAGAPTVECPNFFKLGHKWVLIVSPSNRPEYFVGSFNADTCRFESQERGTLDCDGHFYAPNTLQAADGRRIVWGWVTGFPGGRGWNGCLTLPRQLAISAADGRLLQRPAPQIEKLRGHPMRWSNVALGGSSKSFSLPETNTLEIRVELSPNTVQKTTVTLKSERDERPYLVVEAGDSKIRMMGVESQLSPAPRGRPLELRIFVDRSVVEVYANEEVCGTTVIHPPAGRETLEIKAENESAQLRTLEAWPMHGIWD